jgi:hypothetical protein
MERFPTYHFKIIIIIRLTKDGNRLVDEFASGYFHTWFENKSGYFLASSGTSYLSIDHI